MSICLLAPVPVEHIDSAVEAAAHTGRVAFASGDPKSDWSGSSTWELFTKLGAEGLFGELPVFIHTTLSGQQPGHPRFKGPVVSWRGTLAGYSLAGPSGEHLHPEERPATALATDSGGAVGYWIVEGFEALPPENRPMLLTFRTDQKGKPGKPLSGLLRGPMLAHVPSSLS